MTLKAKYFTAGSREAAEEMAATYFGVEKAMLRVEVVCGEEEGAEEWQILALSGTPEETSRRGGSFGIYFEPEGVHLELYPESGGGAPLDSFDLMQHLSRKNISGLSMTDVQNLMAREAGRAKVAPQQQEQFYGEDLLIEVSRDEMEATARLLPPEPGGAALDMEGAKEKLTAAGITHGVDDKALAGLLDAKDYREPGVIAEAIAPKNGEDGKLIFNFSTDERTGQPREIGGGRVDYRSLDLFEPVEEGQLLVTREFATEGEPGTTVLGKPIKQRPGKEATFPRGKNVNINEDKTEMHSMCAGMVDFINNSVNVSSVYKINGDCDLSVGNIDFDGSVQITGSLRSGHVVKATGGVTIGGVVEAATIISGGNVEIKSGMQGADKGRIEASGSVTALYIERGTVVADGSVSVDVCIHSLIETGGTLTAKGKRGAIIGGRVGAAGDVVANFVGAISNTQTEIAVGVMPRKRERLQFLEKEMVRLQGELVKLDQLDAYLSKTEGKMDAATWDKLHRSGVENRRINNELIEDHKIEIGDLKYEMEHATESRVHVFETAFHGARIIIGSDMYKVLDDISFATFRSRDGQVTYGPCELSKEK